jgi:hypothetical protein
MTAEATVALQPSNGEPDRDHKRQLAILKATGLDRLPPEQRELTLAIAKRYDLDLLLRHIVSIDGKPYVTRDALLWIAHRSGQFDGISVSRPIVEDDYWYCEATVWRRDMTHPFVYGGRYPTKGGNQKFAPEMCVKVAESMALRRAFNISAPSQDERWDADMPAAEPEAPKSLAEKAAEKAAAITVTERTDDGFTAVIDDETGEIIEATPAPKAEATTTAKPTTPTTADETAAKADRPIPESATQCASVSKLSGEQCRREAGHGQLHRTTNEAWAQADAA